MDIQRNTNHLHRRRYLWWLGGGLAVTLAVALSWVSDPAMPAVDRDALWLGKVERGEMRQEVRAPGRLVPREVRWLAATRPARVERILVRPGAEVAADSVLLELASPELEQEYMSATAALAAAKADYAARKMMLQSDLLDRRATASAAVAEHESARLQAEAESDLAKAGIISRLQARRSELEAEQRALRVDIERQRVAALEQTIHAQLEADRARLGQLEHVARMRAEEVAALRVRAGITGVLQEVSVQEGQQVAAGSNLARVADVGALRAELRVAESQARHLQLAQRVAVDSRNGIAEGRIVRIDPAVLNGTVLVDVELVGELPIGARPDLSVDGTIEIARLADVLYVGRPAHGQPDGDTTLFRLGDDGIARRVPVQLGRASVNYVEIVAGLQVGDELILSDTSLWDDAEALRVR